MAGPGSVFNKMCIGLKNIPMKVLCILLVVLQSFFIDVVIISCYGDGLQADKTCKPCTRCYWWIAGDIVISGMFIVAFVVSYKHLTYHSKFKRLEKHHISYGVPLSCITWFVYASYTAAKVGVIFKTDIDDRLPEDSFIGPQFLKAGICLSGVVFILFVESHHDAKESSKERMYINMMASGVTFDVLDTVEFLSVLFVKDTGLVLTFPLEDAILAISIINLIRPTFSFVVLILNHFGATRISRELTAANALVYIFLVNLPFMAIRMYLWHNLGHDMSVFLVKNFVMMFIGAYELYQIAIEKTLEEISVPKHRGDVRDGEKEALPLPERAGSSAKGLTVV